MMLKRAEKLLKLTVACSMIPVLALLCIPICISMSGSTGKMVSILVACAFWGGLILEQVFFWCANKSCKRHQKKANKAKQMKNAPVGLIAFGTSREAKFCDIVLGISLVLSVVFFVVKLRNDWIVILGLAALLWSFNLHCVFNGKTYRYIKACRLIKKRAESK